jgi:hypothetical protein
MVGPDKTLEEGVGLTQKIRIDGVTTCSKCIKITITVPEECRMTAEMLGERTKQIFQKELLRDLCRGCPLEDARD